MHLGLQPKQFADPQLVPPLRLAQSLPGPPRGEVKRRTPAELVKPGDDIVEPADEPRLLADPLRITLGEFPNVAEAAVVGEGAL